jgi:hypothetical protein
MKKLQAEIDDAMPDAQTIPDITILQRLPYLNAFIKEGRQFLLSQLYHSQSRRMVFDLNRFEALRCSA